MEEIGNPESSVLIESAIAALLFVFVFLFGNRLRAPGILIKDKRSIISFGGGMTSAYVFVHLMPELHGAQEALEASASEPLRFSGMGIYFVALIGFLLFYGLEHLRGKLRDTEEPEAPKEGLLEYRIELIGFAVYVAMMAYLLVHNIEETSVSVLTFAIAIAFHLLAVDHEFRREHPWHYARRGSYFLAAAAAAGWGIAQLIEFPPVVLAMLVAFVSGSVIMNSLVMELPSEKDGRFLPFLCGGIIYGLILLPLG